jgi:drug/metabolite transporter (DMT)-like permease
MHAKRSAEPPERAEGSRALHAERAEGSRALHAERAEGSRALHGTPRLHAATGRWRLGLALAVTTMLLWGVLPFALEGILAVLDPFTITWARFGVSALLLGAILAARGDLPRGRDLRGSAAGLLAVATLGLAANYALFLFGLQWTSSADTQVMIQLGPVLLALGGIAVFRERLMRAQWIGLGVLVVGLVSFVASRLGGGAASAARLPRGAGLIFLAALTWAIYGLAQKQLLRGLSSAHVLLCVYVGCAVLFSPLARPGELAGLDAVQAGLLAFAALNTLVAYGAFAESLAHWEASRVGAILALSPLATLLVGALLPTAWSTGSRGLAAQSWLGALLVVAGSMATSLGGASAERDPGVR